MRAYDRAVHRGWSLTASGHYLLIVVVVPLFVTAFFISPALAQQDLPSPNPADWAALDMPSLVKTAEAICMTDKYTADDRSAIATFVTQKYADASKQADFDIKGWVYLVGVVGPNLADPVKQALAKAVVEKVVPDDKAASQLSDTQVVQAANALLNLGQKDKANAVAIAWVAGGGNYQQATEDSLRELAKHASLGGEAGREARSKLMGHVSAAYLANAQATLSMKAWNWYDLTKYLSKDLAEADRLAWANQLKAAFGGTAAAMGALTGTQFRYLMDGLRELGDGQRGQWAVEIVNQSQAWKQWETNNVAMLAGSVPKGGKGSDQAVATIREHVFKIYLASTEATRSVKPWDWTVYVSLFGAELSHEDARDWGLKLCAAYAENDAALRGLAVNEMLGMTEAIKHLGVTSAAGQLALAWLSDEKTRNTCQPDDWGMAAEIAAHNDPAATAALMGQLEPAWLAALAAGHMSWQNVEMVARAWNMAGQQPKAQEWAVRTYAAAVANPEPSEAEQLKRMDKVFEVFALVKLTGEGDTAIAGYLADLAKRGVLNDSLGNPPTLASGVATLEARSTLEAQLKDSNGAPRLMVAKILSWSNAKAGQLDTWKASLDTSVKFTAGDTRALWLLARAYAEGVGSAPYNPGAGRQWYEEAQAADVSEPAKVQVLLEVARAMSAVKMYKQALATLQSAGGQITSEQSAALLNALHQEIDAANGAFLREQTHGCPPAGQVERGQRRFGPSGAEQGGLRHVHRRSQALARQREGVVRPVIWRRGTRRLPGG